MTFRQIFNHLNHRSTSLLPKNKYLQISLILVSFFFLTLISTKIFAKATYFDKSSAITTGNNQEAWLDEALGGNMVSLYNGMTGGISKEFFEAYVSGKSPATAYVPGGAFGTMNNLIATLSNPPASGVEYIAQVKDSFLGKPAYAQGVGFQGLQFLLPLWRGFRNAVYVLASIVFVVIGIMIMLRVKISPQAVVTVQSAIPQLITTLILVTFSYAIAGLVIDICNFVQGLVVALLFSVNGTNITDTLFNQSAWSWKSSGTPGLGNIGDAVYNYINNGTANSTFSFKNLSDPGLHTLQILTYRAAPGWISLTMLGGLMGSIVVGFFMGGVGNGLIGSSGTVVFETIGRTIGGVAGGVIGGLLVPLILCIVVAIWLIKLYFGLLKNYVTLIFKIILSPLEIGMGAFPNSKMGFSSWILDVFANMAVFPVVGIFLVLLNMVTDAVGKSGLSTVWVPSLLVVGQGGSSAVTASIISGCIGLAGLALLSKLPDLVPQAIFMIKPTPWGQAIGQGLGEIGKPAQFGGQMVLESSGRLAQERRDAAIESGKNNVFRGLLGTAADAGETFGLIKGGRKR